MKSWIIYKHTLVLDCPHFGWSYIGQTCRNKNQRWRKGKGYIHNTVFARAIHKYGWENFEHSVLEVCTDQETANEREKYWIAFYHTYVGDPTCHGYNMTIGGDSTGYAHAAETKELIKQRLKERFPMGRCGKDHPMYGKPLSEEHKQYLRDYNLAHPTCYWLGKPRTEETKEKLRQANLGKRLTEEQKLVVNTKRLITRKAHGSYDCWQPVMQLEITTGATVKIWEKLSEAASALQIPPGNITKVCQGIRHSAGGFGWKYYKEQR